MPRWAETRTRQSRTSLVECLTAGSPSVRHLRRFNERTVPLYPTRELILLLIQPKELFLTRAEPTTRQRSRPKDPDQDRQLKLKPWRIAFSPPLPRCPPWTRRRSRPARSPIQRP